MPFCPVLRAGQSGQAKGWVKKMSSYTYGFIGTGNMGSALAAAVAKSGSGSILLSNRTLEKARRLAEKIGAGFADNLTLAKSCEVLFLGVKPQMMSGLLTEISPVLQERTRVGDRFILVSMAAGLTLESLEDMVGIPCPIVRLMPNTPVSVEAGVTLYTHNDRVQKEEMERLLAALDATGELIPLSESQFDAGSALSGCGPAFADLFLEALADGGVRAGLPRSVALGLAGQMLLGSAKLAQVSGRHPGELKDAVCSPAGSTVEGVALLENRAFRGAVSDAVMASYRRTKELGKPKE